MSAILSRCDPIGVNFEENTDEYDPEAGTIIARLRNNATPDEVVSIVHEEFVRWFSSEVAGPKEKYTSIAAEILATYRRDALR